MAWRFVKQPDGRLARFSDIVDNFTHYNMDADEAVRMCIEEYDLGPVAAQLKVERGVDDDHCGQWGPRVADDGLDRWRDSLTTLGGCSGMDALRDAMDEMGFPEWADIVQHEDFVDENGEVTGGNTWLTRPTP